jgi:hypothetical protein
VVRSAAAGVAGSVTGYGSGMERGSDKHGPRKDDALVEELQGMLGEAGGHREEWRDPEPPADDDPDLTADVPDDRPR